MKIQHLVILFSLLLSFTAFNQEESVLEKVDSLLNISQPNTAQSELWNILETARSNENHQVLMEVFPYFNKVLYPLDAEERAELYFKILKTAKDLPEPSNAIATLQLIQSVAFNHHSWFSYGYLKMYDSLNMSEDIVRYNFVLGNIQALEKQLDHLKEYDFKPYQENLLQENDSLHLFQSLSDYVAYQLIQLYESPIIEYGGVLKKSNVDNAAWYANSNEFIHLELQKENLTNKILRLYQIIEKNNANHPDYLSTAVYQRLHYLKRSFHSETKINTAWSKQFDFFETTSARSKFLFEIAKSKYLEGKEYHFKNNPGVEGLIKKAHDQLTAELESFPKNNFRHEISTLLQVVESKNLNVSLPNVYHSHKKIPLRINHKNLSDQVIRIYKVENFDPLSILGLKAYAKAEELTLVRTLELELKNKNLFQERSTELLLDEITKNGQYFIVATKDKKSLTELAASDSLWNAENIISTQLTISEISATTATFNNVYSVVVLDQKGDAVQNAEVNLYYYNYQRDYQPAHLKKGKTNKDGIFTFPVHDRGRFIFYTVQHENSILYGRDYTTSVSKEIESGRIALFKDRSIYRPGQSIYFKGIAYQGKDNSYKIAANKSIEITVKDASSQEIYRSTFITNEFGSIDGSLQLPISTSLGNFQLIAKGEGDFASSSTSFSVEEYKRPTFEVKLNQPKEEAKLNDTILVSGNAKAFAGFPIRDAQVTYSVYRNWNRYWRSYYAPFSGDLLKTDTLKTDKDGNFNIDFFAGVDPNAVENAYYNYEVKVKVTDISGETHEQTLSLHLNKVGLSVQVNAPHQFFTHETEFAVVDVVNLAGEKQKSFYGTVEIYQKQSSEQFLDRIWNNAETTRFEDKALATLFPNMKLNAFSAQPNPDKFIKTVSFQSGDTLKINDWINSEQGNYILKFVVLSEAGDTLRANHNLQVIDVNSKVLPLHQALWTFVSSNEAKVGRAIDFQVGSSFKNAKALVSVYRHNEIINQEWVDLKDRYSLCYTVTEEDRGILTFDVILLNNGVFYTQSQKVNVPFDHKILTIKTSIFRDLLQPGQKEQWSFTVQDNDGSFVKAELAAVAYDASLDQFRSHSWRFSPYYLKASHFKWSNHWTRNISSTSFYNLNWQLRNVLNEENLRYKNVLNSGHHYMHYFSDAQKKNLEMAAPTTISRTEMAVEEVILEQEVSVESEDNQEMEGVLIAQEPVIPRTNFNETAFFYPTIYSNDSNQYVLNFTLPESLTKWKLLMLAHNKELQIGDFQREIIAQKELMVMANSPRFVRQGDVIDFAAKVVNLTEEEQTVTVQLKLSNPINNEVLDLTNDEVLKTITLGAGDSEEVSWKLNVGSQEVIQYTITAGNENFSDGEQNIIPVLNNRVLITETDHVVLRKKGETQHEFEAFKNQNSSTLENKAYVIEYTDNLAWNAVLALPYLSRGNNQSVTALINSYYANTIAENIVKNNPKIQVIFNQWKSKSPDVLLSELEKNETLKTILLEQTPWVVDAQNETEQRRRIAQLFELNQLTHNQEAVFNELKRKQNADGGFSWFGGGESNLYITQNVLTRLGQLEQLGMIENTRQTRALIQAAERFAAKSHVTKYEKHIKERTDYHLTSLDVYWLYSRTLFHNENNALIEKVTALYKEKLKKEWTRFSPYLQAMIGIYFHHENMDKEAHLVYASLKDRAKKNTHLGMYWVENSGYYWHQNNIGSQAMIIAFFQKMKASESMMDDMRLWLILNKESNTWETGVATADAIYAILSSGRDYLSTSQQPKIKVGNKELIASSTSNENTIEVEWIPGLGQVKNKWAGEEINPDLGKVEIEKVSEGPAVLNMYWQYTDELSKIKSSQNQSLKIQKKYHRIVAGQKQESAEDEQRVDSTFTVGDKIEITLIVTVDRDLEFVHIKDLRPAGFEPTMTTSGYNYNKGLSYYQSPKDISMEYFVDNMPKGTYKFSYTVYATHSGVFNSGTAEVQCYYAPKFSGNSSTMDVEINR